METTPTKKPMLPNAVAVLVLGICSIVVPCAGLVTGIVGWALSGTGRRIYRENPSVWEGYQMLQAGYVLSVIGTILHGLWLAFVLVVMVIALAAGPAAVATWSATLPWWLID